MFSPYMQDLNVRRRYGLVEQDTGGTFNVSNFIIVFFFTNQLQKLLSSVYHEVDLGMKMCIMFAYVKVVNIFHIHW